MKEWMPENPYFGTDRDLIGNVAQAKELVMWLDMPCTLHGESVNYYHRRDCTRCWQQLKKDVGL